MACPPSACNQRNHLNYKNTILLRKKNLHILINVYQAWFFHEYLTTTNNISTQIGRYVSSSGPTKNSTRLFASSLLILTILDQPVKYNLTV